MRSTERTALRRRKRTDLTRYRWASRRLVLDCSDGRMLCDELHRLTEQRLAWLHAVPRRGARGVRQRNAVGGVATILHPERASDRVEEGSFAKELADRQLAHGNYEIGF